MDAGATIAVRLALLSLAMSPLIGWAAIRRWGAPSWLTPPRMRLLFLALVTLGVVHLVWHVTTSVTTDIGIGRDALWYWGVDLDDPYRATYLNQELFPYSPAAALLFAPFTSLSWPAFLALWCSINLGVVAWLTRRDMLVWILFPPLVWLLVIGNIEVLIGFAVVLGFRWPWMWAFIVLTKVTPGIGLLWFAVRREWRSLGIALGSIVLVDRGQLAGGARPVAGLVLVPRQWPGCRRMDPGLVPPAVRRRARDMGRPDRPQVDGAGGRDGIGTPLLVRVHGWLGGPGRARASP